MSFKRKPPSGDVRQVRSTGQNLRGVITNKKGRLVQFESWLERALILRLDRDPAVLDYQSQPEIFEFTDTQGKRHTYTPDFKVWRDKGDIEIHEVTLTVRRPRPNIQGRETAARQICQRRGWSYVVHTEQTLPQGSELANLLALAGYRPAIYAHQAVVQAVITQLELDQPLALDKLVKHISAGLHLSEGQVTATVCHLLWHGVLRTELGQLLFNQGTIVPGSPVWLAVKEADDVLSAA